jgi:hypothetical protein
MQAQSQASLTDFHKLLIFMAVRLQHFAQQYLSVTLFVPLCVCVCARAPRQTSTARDKLDITCQRFAFRYDRSISVSVGHVFIAVTITRIRYTPVLLTVTVNKSRAIQFPSMIRWCT